MESPYPRRVPVLQRQAHQILAYSNKDWTVGDKLWALDTLLRAGRVMRDSHPYEEVLALVQEAERLAVRLSQEEAEGCR
jgi:hypothetical protein